MLGGSFQVRWQLKVSEFWRKTSQVGRDILSVVSLKAKRLISSKIYNESIEKLNQLQIIFLNAYIIFYMKFLELQVMQLGTVSWVLMQSYMSYTSYIRVWLLLFINEAKVDFVEISPSLYTIFAFLSCQSYLIAINFFCQVSVLLLMLLIDLCMRMVSSHVLLLALLVDR